MQTVNVSKTRIEVQPQNWSYHQTQPGRHGNGWMRGTVSCRGDGQSWNIALSWRMALVGISLPWFRQLIPLHPGPRLFGSTLQLQPWARATKPPWSWGLSQGPTPFTVELSRLWFVFGEFNPPSPTSARYLMASHYCCYCLFLLMFSSIPQC